ncbi:MAG: VanZ family protein [Phycisphaerae bacterium]|nr:VanZ family protein [Phycisphaerae bacterium]
MTTAHPVVYASSRFRWIHSTRLHLVLTSFLVVGLPFLMLRAYMQERLGMLSLWEVELWGVHVPVVPTVAAVVAVIGLWKVRPYINRRRVAAVAVAILMVAYAQYINDYYYGHVFYEIQMNWHYLAYMLIVFMAYRDFAPRGFTPDRVIRITYGGSLVLSSFDEGFQFFLNNRVFDSGDISKDVWGCLMALLIIYSGSREAKWLPLRHRHLLDYFRHPGSLMLLLGIFNFSFLTYASLLNERREIPQVVCLTLATVGVAFALIHVSQFRPMGRILLGLLVLAVAVQAWALVKYRNADLYWRPGLAFYRGIVWPYFDFVILPDGTFHPATKLHEFRPRDRQFFLRQCSDIILIGSGPRGEGGNGFMTKRPHFMYNPDLKRGTQIVILPTKNACEEFNWLKKEGKNVLFVVNND